MIRIYVNINFCYGDEAGLHQPSLTISSTNVTGFIEILNSF